MSGMNRWKCTWCGTSQYSAHRPSPGNCPRKERTRDGKMKPHTWVKDN